MLSPLTTLFSVLYKLIAPTVLHFLCRFGSDTIVKIMRPLTIHAAISLVLATAPLLAQTPKPTTVTLPDVVTAAFIDRPGELYLQTSSGHLQRYDKDGNLRATSPDTIPPTLFDPRDGARLFAYYRAKQQYTYLNPSFEAGILNPIDAAFSTEPWLVCASGDYNVWILDAADWSLKKIDTQKGVVLVETPVTGITADKREAITYMREYQGFLFVLERDNALHMYSSMGKHLRTVAAPGIRYFNFLGEDLYYENRRAAVTFNLFSTESVRVDHLPNTTPPDFMLKSDERLFFVYPRYLEVHPVLKP